MSLKEYLERAKKEKKALFQFSFSSFEQFKAFAEFSHRYKIPLLLGLSEGGAEFLGLELPLEWRDYFRKKLKTPLFLNLDHGHTLSLLERAIELGFDMVHFDAHSLSFEEALSLTQKLVKRAHKKNILVEGETEKIKGKSGWNTPPDPSSLGLTDPTRALLFWEKTKIDLFAPSVGNIHGKAAHMPPLHFSLLKDLSLVLPTYLVLHGASGYAKKDLRRAILAGVQKINIGTELRMAFNKALLQEIEKGEVKPYRYFKRAQKALWQTAKYYLSLSLQT